MKVMLTSALAAALAYSPIFAFAQTPQVPNAPALLKPEFQDKVITQPPRRLPDARKLPALGALLKQQTYTAYVVDRSSRLSTYSVPAAFYLNNPAGHDKLVRRFRKDKTDPRWFFVDAEGGMARVIVDRSKRLAGVVRLSANGVATIALDFNGDRSIDYLMLQTPSETLWLIGETARAAEGFEMFNPLCAIEKGSTNMSDYLHAAAQPTCSVTKPSGGGRSRWPGTSDGNAVEPSYKPADFWSDICPAILSAEGRTDPTMGGPQNWAWRLGGFGIGQVVRSIVFKVLFDEGRGTGWFTDPTHTGSYPCEYGYGSCGSPETMNDPAYPAGVTPDSPAPDTAEKRGGSGAGTTKSTTSPLPGGGNAGLLRVCQNIQKSAEQWWETSGQTQNAVRTDCLDPVTQGNGLPDPVTLSCFGRQSGTQSPSEVLGELMGSLRDGCTNRAAQPGPDQRCVSDIGARRGSVYFGLSDIVAAQTGIERCPPKVCR
jgi:hypothetical protein